ncbi:Centrosomal protein POC5 [Fasciolopsis buskii]|uniref:Centrosomal protein POC5 n=1 Tax=Fasciolopsis buskii TaxID=27845 RepID=A0A8E0RQK9_9TREM|nr:Centrosomal protein POC5 [Fasciolopsis buski]
MAEPQAESCAETNEPMIDYQKIGAKRLDELFSREQFCSMADVFDNLSKQFKEQINSNYSRIRDEMQTATSEIVNSEMKRILLMTQQLRDQIISLRAVVQNQERMIARKDQVIDDLMADLKRINQNAETSREICQAKHELENELRVARAELEATRATQAEEQATLKMALMRGVCALNMETMSLFHRDTRSQTEEVGSGDVLNQNAHNWTNNGTLLVGNQDTYTTQFLSADGNGLLSGPCGIPVQKRTNDFINRIGPSPKELMFSCSNEAWPRQMPFGFNYDSSRLITGPNCFKPPNPNEFCALWLNQTQGNTVSDKKLTKDSSYRPDVHQISANSAEQFRMHNAGDSPNSVDADSFVLSSNNDDCQIMELPITTAIKSDIESSQFTSSYCNPDEKITSSHSRLSQSQGSEGARKLLNNRTLSVQRMTTPTVPASRWADLPKAHTVELGVPSGPSMHSSCVTASVQVLRHQPVSQVRTVMLHVL